MSMQSAKLDCKKSQQAKAQVLQQINCKGKKGMKEERVD